MARVAADNRFMREVPMVLGIPAHTDDRWDVSDIDT
jgi:hypothetical protein